MKYHCGIYKIENIVTGDFYIGQTINFKKREYEHFYKLKKNKHQNKYLQNSFNKYEKENFIFKVILYCNKNNLTFYEQLLVDNLSPSFNLCLECVDSIKGIKMDQTLMRIKRVCKKTGNVYKVESTKNLTDDEINDKFYEEEEYLKCTISGNELFYGKIPKTIKYNKYIWNYKNKYISNEKILYFRFFLSLYLYLLKLKNKKFSKNILKLFRNRRDCRRLYTGIKTCVESNFKEYPDNLLKKTFKGVLIEIKENKVFVFVKKSKFKKMYILYF